MAVRIALCKGFSYRLIAIVIASDETTLCEVLQFIRRGEFMYQVGNSDIVCLCYNINNYVCIKHAGLLVTS